MLFFALVVFFEENKFVNKLDPSETCRLQTKSLLANLKTLMYLEHFVLYCRLRPTNNPDRPILLSKQWIENAF